MASSIGDLGTNTVQSGNQNQFLGESADGKVNPLLELAQGIMGNAATAQGRGDMAFGGGAGVPTTSSYSDPLGGQHTQVVRKGFTTPGTTHGTTPVTSTTPVHTPVVQAPGQPAPVPHPTPVPVPVPVPAPVPVPTPVSPGMGAPGPGGGAW